MTKADRYSHLSILFGSLRRAFFVYATIFSVMLGIIAADGVWRFVTGGWTLHDAFGATVLLAFAWAMGRGLVALHRYIKAH